MSSQDTFDVIGIQIKTTNKLAIQENTILHLQQQFSKCGDTILNRVDNRVIPVYYDYADKREGEYTLLLGYKVSCVDTIPIGMSHKHVCINKTAIFNVHDIVFDTWKHIWDLEDKNELYRKYNVDYELYDTKTKIYIGLK